VCLGFNCFGNPTVPMVDTFGSIGCTSFCRYGQRNYFTVDLRYDISSNTYEGQLGLVGCTGTSSC
jgi:hypothetical protein